MTFWKPPAKKPEPAVGVLDTIYSGRTNLDQWHSVDPEITEADLDIGGRRLAMVMICESDHCRVDVSFLNKAATVVLDRCWNVELIVPTVISTVELVNCVNCTVRFQGHAPTIQVDNSRRIDLHIFDQYRPNTNLVTCRTEDIRVYILDDQGSTMRSILLATKYVTSLGTHKHDWPRRFPTTADTLYTTAAELTAIIYYASDMDPADFAALEMVENHATFFRVCLALPPELQMLIATQAASSDMEPTTHLVDLFLDAMRSESPDLANPRLVAIRLVESVLGDLDALGDADGKDAVIDVLHEIERSISTVRPTKEVIDTLLDSIGPGDVSLDTLTTFLRSNLEF